jgi:hypothetical protein
MKAAVRGKKKIAKHTANAAQEMHRISTGANHAAEKIRLDRVVVEPNHSER